jgi:hypothetical protein
MVTELKIKIKVIKLTNNKGAFASPKNGNEWNTLFGSGHTALKKRVVP